MAYKNDVKENLKRKYVYENVPLERVANALSVPFATASRWKRDAKKSGDDWDKIRAARLLSGGDLDELAQGMLVQLMHQFDSTMKHLDEAKDIAADERVKLLASLSDAFNKAIAANKRVMPKAAQLSTALNVVNQLTDFITKHYPHYLPMFAEILEPFARELERKND